MFDPKSVRSPNNYDRDAVSLETGLKCEDPSLAHQSFKDDADINVIVRRFGLTGEMPQGLRVPSYGDFTEVLNFRESMDAVVAARHAFEQIPAEIRARFGNDPIQFVEFFNDPKNKEEAERLGLIVKPVEPVKTVNTATLEELAAALASKTPVEPVKP